MRRDTTARKDGRVGHRPSSLTPQRADTIVTTIAAGNHVTTACYAAGVSTATFYRWITRADEADHAQETGQPLPNGAQEYRAFRDRVLVARANVAQRYVRVIDRAVEGGVLISEEPALDGSGNPIRDDDGQVIMKRVWSQPDGRLALAYLKVAQPSEWGGSPSRLELSGPGGSPLGGEDEAAKDDAARLSARLAAIVAARQASEEQERAEEEEASGGPDGDGVWPIVVVEDTDE